MRKKKSSLYHALKYIQFDKEIKNYNIYLFLRTIIIQKYKISIQDLESSKEYNAVEARMLFFYLLKKYTNYSLRTISILFNIKHHSQIHHSIKLITEYIKKNIYQTTILRHYKDIEEKYSQFLRN